MKRQISGVAEEILKCAEAEFLEKGFADASLRDIAQNSGVSTSSIYTRFGDKSGLFDALVSPVIEELFSWFTNKQEDFHQLDSKVQVKELFSYSENSSNYFIDYIYDNLITFKLLLMKSEGTKHLNFIHAFVEVDVENTKKFIDISGSNLISSGSLTNELIHMLSSAFYTGIFEAVIHDMSREDAYHYFKKLTRFFRCGWKDIFSGQESVQKGDAEVSQ